MKTTEFCYEILDSTSKIELEKEVAKALRFGWKLAGGLQVFVFNGGVTYLQAVYSEPTF